MQICDHSKAVVQSARIIYCSMYETCDSSREDDDDVSVGTMIDPGDRYDASSAVRTCGRVVAATAGSMSR